MFGERESEVTSAAALNNFFPGKGNLGKNRNVDWSHWRYVFNQNQAKQPKNEIRLVLFILFFFFFLAGRLLSFSLMYDTRLCFVVDGSCLQVKLMYDSLWLGYGSQFFTHDCFMISVHCPHFYVIFQLFPLIVVISGRPQPLNFWRISSRTPNMMASKSLPRSSESRLLQHHGALTIPLLQQLILIPEEARIMLGEEKLLRFTIKSFHNKISKLWSILLKNQKNCTWLI